MGEDGELGDDAWREGLAEVGGAAGIFSCHIDVWRLSKLVGCREIDVKLQLSCDKRIEV